MTRSHLPWAKALPNGEPARIWSPADGIPSTQLTRPCRYNAMWRAKRETGLLAWSSLVQGSPESVVEPPRHSHPLTHGEA